MNKMMITLAALVVAGDSRARSQLFRHLHHCT
jgi:hypothetical protein